MGCGPLAAAAPPLRLGAGCRAAAPKRQGWRASHPALVGQPPRARCVPMDQAAAAAGLAKRTAPDPASVPEAFRAASRRLRARRHAPDPCGQRRHLAAAAPTRRALKTLAPAWRTAAACCRLAFRRPASVGRWGRARPGLLHLAIPLPKLCPEAVPRSASQSSPAPPACLAAALAPGPPRRHARTTPAHQRAAAADRGRA